VVPFYSIERCRPHRRRPLAAALFGRVTETAEEFRRSPSSHARRIPSLQPLRE